VVDDTRLFGRPGLFPEGLCMGQGPRLLHHGLSCARESEPIGTALRAVDRPNPARSYEDKYSRLFRRQLLGWFFNRELLFLPTSGNHPERASVRSRATQLRFFPWRSQRLQEQRDFFFLESGLTTSRYFFGVSYSLSKYPRLSTLFRGFSCVPAAKAQDDGGREADISMQIQMVVHPVGLGNFFRV
jgi:hypothetical protein